MARLDGARVACRNTGCGLWTLLECFRDSQCYEIHDKVYGFIGLASDCTHSNIRVDYSKSVQQLFEDVVWFHYQKLQMDASSPNSARLMRFCEFFRSYLGAHPQYCGSLEQACRTQGRQTYLSWLSISASAAMVVERIPTQDQARKLGAPDLIELLDGTIPYSHLSFWREKVDSSLSTVYALKQPEACA